MWLIRLHYLQVMVIQSLPYEFLMFSSAVLEAKHLINQLLSLSFINPHLNWR